MQTNGIAKNQLSYAGIVEIKYKNNNILKFHNAGTTALGDLIGIALSGDQRNISTISSRVPSKLGFYVDIGNEESNRRSLIVGTVPITSAVWGLDVGQTVSDYESLADIGKVQYSSIISSGQVQLGYENIVNSNRLQLQLINNRDEVMATIIEEVTDTDRNLPMLYTALCGGQDALIHWTMFFMNYNQGE